LHYTATASATENLKEEHRIIERMLKILFVACGRLDRGEKDSPKVFRKAINFIRAGKGIGFKWRQNKT